MKILFVTLAFAPGQVSPYPGVNRYSVELARALQEEGVDVRIVTSREDSSRQSESWHGMDIFRLANSKTLVGRMGVLGDSNLLTFGINLRRNLRLYQDVDLVYTNIPLPLARREAWGRPIVFFIHHAYRIWRASDLLTVPFGHIYEHRTALVAHRVVVPSEATRRDVIRSHNLPERKVVAVHHGVDKKVFRPLGEPGTLGNAGIPTLVYAGLLDARKGTNDLVPIFSRVKCECPDVRLLIVGTGPDERTLRKRLRVANLEESVSFFANLSDVELVECLNSAGVFLFPSRLEGFGFTVVEAMACARPVVAYHNATNREVLGNSELLVPEGDTQAFATKIIGLLRGSLRAREIGVAARRRVEQMFDWRSAALGHIDIFKQACEEGGF